MRIFLLYLCVFSPMGLAAPQFKALLFTKTAGYKHDSIPAGIKAIESLAKQNNFEVKVSDESDVFEASLTAYSVIVFLNTTGDILNNTQQQGLKNFVKAGGGFVGIHSAADTESQWTWYRELLGSHFLNHPPKIQTAHVQILDNQHPSTHNLPRHWEVADEWYNFTANPSDKVHVLASLEESSYNGGQMGWSHPISWCHRFDGGRSWYTGRGHTKESYKEPEFLSHLLGGIQWAAGTVEGSCEKEKIHKEVLDATTLNPMELEVAPDGRVIFIERKGDIKIWNPSTKKTVVAGTLKVVYPYEDGLLGLALDPNFSKNHWIYLYYSPKGKMVNRLSRFTLNGNVMDPKSERTILEIRTNRKHCCHSGGSLAFAPDGSLFLSTGDNTNPFESDGFAPIDERNGRLNFDAQKSASSTNDFRGKILRLIPTDSGTPKYELPKDNLFSPSDTHKGEIYVMGVRNPFRISVDPKKGWLYWGDVGPDALASDASRGPEGFDEINQALKPGNFGWPYFIADNLAYHDYDFASQLSAGPFNPLAVINDSPHNYGAQSLPSALPSYVSYSNKTNFNYPQLGNGYRCSMAGPVFYQDMATHPNALPAHYDDSVFIYDWMRNQIFRVQRDGERVLAILPFAENLSFSRPIDMELGPEGRLYVLEWGAKYQGDNKDAQLVRLDIR